MAAAAQCVHVSLVEGADGKQLARAEGVTEALRPHLEEFGFRREADEGVYSKPLDCADTLRLLEARLVRAALRLAWWRPWATLSGADTRANQLLALREGVVARGVRNALVRARSMAQGASADGAVSNDAPAMSTPRKREAPSRVAGELAGAPVKAEDERAAKRTSLAASLPAAASSPPLSPKKDVHGGSMAPSSAAAFSPLWPPLLSHHHTCVMLYTHQHECIAACDNHEPLCAALAHAGFTFVAQPTPRWELPRAADAALLEQLHKEAEERGVLLRSTACPLPQQSAPICRRHGCLCVLRTTGHTLPCMGTRKPINANLGRRFWTCPQQPPKPDGGRRCTWVWEDCGYCAHGAAPAARAGADDEAERDSESESEGDGFRFGCDCGSPDFDYYYDADYDAYD